MPLSDGAARTLAETPTSATRESTGPTSVQLRALWLPMALFALISVADTVSSVYMLLTGMMEEYNPLMRWVWLEGGVSGFVGVKAFLTVVPLLLFNHLKTRRYSLVHRAVWLTIFGYAAIYGLFFCLANY